MNELVAWLTGVLDETERVAREALDEDEVGDWHAERAIVVLPDRVETLRHDGRYGHVAEVTHSRATDHIARHDPRAVLARVEAERAVVKLYDDMVIRDEDGPHPDSWVAGVRETVRWLAYGHRYDIPGYDPSWAPDEGVATTR